MSATGTTLSGTKRSTPHPTAPDSRPSKPPSSATPLKSGSKKLPATEMYTEPKDSETDSRGEGKGPHGGGKGDLKGRDDGTVCLKKELGLLEGVTIIMGIVIGAGIFVTPTGVIAIVGSVGMSLIVWAVTGVMSTIGALCFAELGTMIPESGGMYSYLYESFGPLPAFLCLWVTVVVRNAAGMAAVTLVFSSYLVQAALPHCETVPDLPVRLFAIVLLGFLTWVNCVNVRWAAQVQNVFTASKVVALTVIIVTGATYLAYGRTQNYEKPFQDTNWDFAAIATSFYQSLFTYGGWENLSYMVEELKNPNRNLPLSIIISMSLITVVYTLTNVAYLVVLTPAEMIASEAVAMTFSNRALGVMAWIMPMFVLCSTFGSVNGGCFTQARLIFAGSRKGQLPEALGLVSVDKFLPVPAVVLNSLLTLVMLVSSDMLQLIQYVTCSATLISFGCMCALLWFRYKEPDRERPYKVWLVLPVVYAILQVFLLVLPLIHDPITVGISIALVASGLPVYYLAIHRKDIVEKCDQPLRKLTYCCQMLFRSVAEEKVD